jgi:hypothetical protein
MNDPAMAEHKVALDKILEVASDYLDAEDSTFATSSKLTKFAATLDEHKGQMKILEARKCDYTPKTKNLTKLPARPRKY